MNVAENELPVHATARQQGPGSQVEPGGRSSNSSTCRDRAVDRGSGRGWKFQVIGSSRRREGIHRLVAPAMVVPGVAAVPS